MSEINLCRTELLPMARIYQHNDNTDYLKQQKIGEAKQPYANIQQTLLWIRRFDFHN